MYRADIKQSHEFKSCNDNFRRLLTAVLVIAIWVPSAVFADTLRSSPVLKISLQQISPDTNGGFAYRLVYYVPAAMETFWRFKTDFNSEILLTNDELIEHRVVKTFGNNVITENRYATAPGLRFMWQTTVIAEQYRLEFKLLNAKDCRHNFHYGSIQLKSAGSYTKVTQIAYFDFRGASLWVKYPWYGGMRSTLTKVAKWEQKVAQSNMQAYLVDNDLPSGTTHVRRSRPADRNYVDYLGGPAY